MDDSTANFDVFMDPFKPVLGQLAQLSSVAANPALAEWPLDDAVTSVVPNSLAQKPRASNCDI